MPPDIAAAVGLEAHPRFAPPAEPLGERGAYQARHIRNPLLDLGLELRVRPDPVADSVPRAEIFVGPLTVLVYVRRAAELLRKLLRRVHGDGWRLAPGAEPLGVLRQG